MRIADILIQTLGAGLLLALVVIIVRRKLNREYRCFFAYLVFSALNAIFLLVVSGNKNTYAYAYWLSDGFSAILVLLALNEILHDVFHGFYSFWWFRLIFPSLIVVMCSLAMTGALTNPRSSHVLISVIFYVSGTVSLIQCGVFLVFMLLVMGLRVRCRRYPYYIALGFAILSMGDWTSYALVSGSGYSLVVRYTPPVAYLCATIVWLWCFSGKFEADPRLEFGRRSRRSDHFDPGSTPKLKIS